MSHPVEPGESPEVTGSVVTGSRMQRLFDLRYVIAGLLGVYGVVLVIRGLLDGPEQLARAANTSINLWTGIALVVVSAVFLAWARLRPLGIETGEDLGAPPD
jgi:drug/metabolite transporter (DMT)-like permease